MDKLIYFIYLDNPHKGDIQFLQSTRYNQQSPFHFIKKPQYAGTFVYFGQLSKPLIDFLYSEDRIKYNLSNLWLS